VSLGGGVGNGGNNSTAVDTSAQKRLAQLEEEEEHGKDVRDNLQTILSEKLASLRSKLADMEADDWKYSQRKRYNSSEPNPNVSRIS
jgi:hypothetical protein